MALNAETTTNGSGGSSATSSNFTVSSGQYIIVVVCIRRDVAGTEAVSSVTWDPGGAADAGADLLTAPGTPTQGRARVEIWGVTSPTAGTAGLQVVLDDAAGDWDFTVFHPDNVSGFDTSGAQSSTSASATSSSLNVSSASQNYVIDGILLDGAGTSFSEGANQTDYHNDNLVGDHASVECGVSVEDGTTTNTMSWSWSTNRGVAHAAIEVEISGGVGMPSIDSTDDVDDVSIRFNVTAGSGATSHELHGSTSSPFTPSAGTLLQSLGASPTEALATGLDPDQRYYFILRADDGSDTADSSEYEDFTAPGRPTGVTVDGETTSSLDIEPTGGGVGTAGVEVEVRRMPSGGSWVGVGAFDDTYSWPFTDTGLSANTTYIYEGRCRNDNGVSGWGTSGTSATLSDSGNVTVSVPVGSITYSGLVPAAKGAATFANARDRCAGGV